MLSVAAPGALMAAAYRAFSRSRTRSAPVRGSGIFVSGAGFTGGRLVVTQLETGAVYSDGGIPEGTPDQITGGVFTVFNAHVDEVRNRGPVVTYGGLTTHGAGVSAFELHGAIGAFRVGGGFAASGGGFDKI